MVYGLWFMVYGLWFMVYGLWFMVYGLWFTVYGLWFRVQGRRQAEHEEVAASLGVTVSEFGVLGLSCRLGIWGSGSRVED